MEFGVSPELVMASLKKIEEKLENIHREREALYVTMTAYANNFQDEISEKSVELIKKIDDQLQVLSKALEDFSKRMGKSMAEIEAWRSYQ